MLRLLPLFAALGFVGCHVISPEHLKNPPPTEEPQERVVEALPTARLKETTDDPLLSAADCLAANNYRGAIKHLTGYVTKHPDQLVFRMQLAELLLKEEQLAEAQAHFHEVIVSAQQSTTGGKKQLVHAHTRLMEIAEAREDAYNEQLHRGIGLYRIVEQLQDKNSDVEPADLERMLFKAVTAFKAALEARPNDGRAAWYLYLAWTRLDQPRPAEKCLRQAQANAAFAMLTPAEAKDLALAGVK